MKAKLVKDALGYYLKDGDCVDGFKLSTKNCQAIERGYDLDELAEQEFPYDFDCPLFETLGITEKSHKSILIGMLQGTLQKGFQKALELMGDKKFSEEDVRLMLIDMARLIATKELRDDWDLDVDAFFRKRDFFIDKQIQSLQQTEWDVEFEMEYVGECNGNNDNGCFQDSPGHNCGCFERKPKLDATGCLILKTFKSE